MSNDGPVLVKITDVATRAGVSPATVSRVLNENPKVASHIRERVVEAAEALNYVRNGAARALRATSTSMAGAIIPTLSHAIYATMIDGLQSRLSERGISLMINTTLYDLDVELQQTRVLLERGAEALVLVGATHRSETIELIERHGVPFVVTYTTTAVGHGGAAGFDNVRAAQVGAKFLHDMGHRRFGMLSGLTRDNDRAAERQSGFRDALLRLGVPASDCHVVEAPYDFESGTAAMASLRRAHPDVTAVFCGSDLLAGGAIKFCVETGIKVPGEVSILGFDDLAFARLLTPGLSTLEVPASQMGRMAAEYLVARPDQRVHLRTSDLPVRLVLRESTGPAPRI